MIVLAITMREDVDVVIIMHETGSLAEHRHMLTSTHAFSKQPYICWITEDAVALPSDMPSWRDPALRCSRRAPQATRNSARSSKMLPKSDERYIVCVPLSF